MRVRLLLRLAAALLTALLTAVAVIYLVIACEHIPSPLPGREAGSTGHRPGFAAAAFALALLVAAAGAYGTRPRRPRRLSA